MTRFNFDEVQLSVDAESMDVNETVTAAEHNDKEKQVADVDGVEEDGEIQTDSEDEMDGDEVPAIPFPQLR